MNCAECQPLLEELFDGEAPPEAARRTRLHLATCDACSLALEELRAEQELYLRYDFHAEPAEAFWSQVMERATSDASDTLSARPSLSTRATLGARATLSARATLAARASLARPRSLFARLRARLARASGAFIAPRFSPTLTAALILCAVALTVFVMRHTETSRQTLDRASGDSAERADAQRPALYQQPSHPTDDAASSPPREAAAEQLAKPKAASRKAGVMLASGRGVGVRGVEDFNRRAPLARSNETSDQLVREAEQKYLAAILILSRDVQRNRARLDADTAARFERTLATIDRTIAGTRRAVRQHPGDPVAINYMLTAYAKKVEVLREMASY